MQPGYKIIETIADLDHGLAALSLQCPAMQHAYLLLGRPPLRRYPPGLAGLARIVVAQQVSAASAAAIWSRLDTAVADWKAERLLAMQTEDLRGAGLSQPKVRTLLAIAAAVAGGQLDLDVLADQSDDDVSRRLTAVNGIGPWSADIYLLFCLGRADAFAPGDLALATAAKHLLGLDERPDRGRFELIAQRWQPWRGVAARLLWAWHPCINSQPIPTKTQRIPARARRKQPPKA